MILDVIYNLFVTPIQMVIEFIFSIIYRLCESPGLSIIGVSLAVNFLVLPLYKKSDALQDEERLKQAQMKPWLDHIKKKFKGDERYMMTQTYYRQVGYKPIYALRSSISLLLQIPFFIAAYQYLSNLGLLQGASFLFFNNLGEPDQLIPFFGGLKLNLLPILMTAINIISGAVYTRGYPLKDKLQLYIVALLFLVLLYNSPSGLVFYWTLNNIFSLGKNIVMKALPKREKRVRPEIAVIDKKIYIFGALVMSVLTGLVIPLSVISNSSTEFINVNYGPIFLAVNTFSTMLGFFVVWFGVFYYLCSNRGKNVFTYGIWILIGISIVSFIFFGKDYGNMSAQLIYSNNPSSSITYHLINFAVLIFTGVVFFFILKYFKKITRAIVSILLIAGIGISVVNMISISGEVSEAENKIASSTSVDTSDISISRTEKNVVVIMLDRAISAYFLENIEKDDKLAKSFEGFTYYPNAVSYGNCTNISAPSVFGGYEYTPSEMDARSDESIKDKHNEAISVLPKLFGLNNYNVSVCDIPYAGDYSWTPNMSYFDQYDNCKGYTLTGNYSDELNQKFIPRSEKKQKRNMICYSAFRCMPSIIGEIFYDEGRYYTTSTSADVPKSFIDSYSVLNNLANIANVSDEGSQFIMMQNATTHEPTFLSQDTYEPDENTVSDWAATDQSPEAHRDVNMCAMKKLAAWFDYLRSEGAWDNTKIIIASDHGRSFNEFDYMDLGFVDVELYNPLMLVKDFNSNEFSIDNSFVTSADVTTFATNGAVDDSINPFTLKEINDDAKLEGALITTNGNWDTELNNGNVFTGGGTWYRIKNNVFDANNWKEVK